MSRPFTPADDQTIVDLHEQGLTYREIADRIGRPSGWCVSYRHKRLLRQQKAMAASPQARTRPCMRCRTVFDSPHFGVRHCQPCRVQLHQEDDGLGLGAGTTRNGQFFTTDIGGQESGNRRRA